MNPIALRMGSLSIRWYGIAYAVALLAAIGVVKIEVARKGMDLDLNDLIDFVLISFPLGLIGARIFYALFYLDFFSRNPLALVGLGGSQGFGLAGLALHGGLIGGFFGLLIFVRWKEVNFWEYTDCLSPALILGQAIGRAGNLLNGDAYGYPTDLPWGLEFPPNTPAGMEFPGQKLHPTMIYEMILDILIFALLWKLRKGKHKRGFITSVYLITYSVGRSVVSFYRAGSLWIGPIRAPHLISIFIVAGFGYYLIDKELYRLG